MRDTLACFGLSALVALVACTTVVTAKPQDKADRQFESISNLLEKADREREAGNVKEAGKLYGATIAAYQDFSRNFPEAWDELIQFRMAYCRNQLMSMLAAQRTASIQAEAGANTNRPSAVPPALVAAIGSSIEHCRLGRYDEAEAAMNAVVEEFPDCSPAYLILATVCVGKGDLVTASALLERAIVLDPTNKEAHYNLCQLVIRAEDPDFDAARAHYRQALQCGAERDFDLEAVLGLE